MNLNQMYYYVAVCKYGGFSRAAEEIYVSQPTLSKQIAALEAELGLQLIDRQKPRVFTLTPVGEEYLRSFKRIIRDFEETSSRARLADSRGRLRYRIGLMESWFLHDLIRVCRETAASAFPEAELEFEFLRPDEMTQLRRDGKLDLALMRDDVNWPVDGYVWEKLTDILGVIYTSAESPCVEDGDILITRLQNKPLYCPFSDDMLNAGAHPVFAMLDDSRLEKRPRATLQAMRMGVLASNGFGFADEWSDVLFDPHFCVKRLRDMPRGVMLAWREEDDSELTIALSRRIREWTAAPRFSLRGGKC